MNVSRPTYVTGTDLVSLADMKEFLRVDHSDEDTTITALLDAASAFVSDYTNRHLNTSGTATFFLPSFRPAALAYGPVRSISSVTYADGNGDTQTLSTSLYYLGQVRDNTCMIYFHDVPTLELYNALPITVTAAVGSTPTANIKHAVRMLVAHWYENRRSVITGTTASEVPMGVHSLLNVERIVDQRQ